MQAHMDAFHYVATQPMYIHAYTYIHTYIHTQQLVHAHVCNTIYIHTVIESIHAYINTTACQQHIRTYRRTYVHMHLLTSITASVQYMTAARANLRTLLGGGW